MMSHWPLSLWVNFIILRIELTRFCVFVVYNFVLWMSILEYVFVWVFVMHIFVRMTIHIILVWVFFMHIFVRMTIHIIVVWVFVMHISVRMTINGTLRSNTKEVRSISSSQHTENPRHHHHTSDWWKNHERISPHKILQHSHDPESNRSTTTHLHWESCP